MFHIIFNADENYIKYLAVLMTSIIKNTNAKKGFKDICASGAFGGGDICENFNIGENRETFKNVEFENLSEEERSEGYIFHILSDFISEKTQENLKILEKELAKIYPCEVVLHIFKQSEFESFPISGAAHSSKLPYFRLKACEIVKSSKCLYLDSDMLVMCDLREVFALDLGDKMLGIIGDCGSKKRKIKFKDGDNKRVFYFDEHYFNSGFLLFNVKECKNLFENAQNLARKCYYITAADQDLLNAIIPQNKALKLPFAYNFQTICFCYVICKDEEKWRLNYTREEFTKSFKNPKILHFGEKPWKYLKSYFSANNKNINEIWWESAQETPIFSEELLKDKENIKDYLAQAALGFRILESLNSPFGLFKIHKILKEDSKDFGYFRDSKDSKARGWAILDDIFGLCLILGEMVFYAKRRGRGALNVLLKAIKVKKAFLKYSKISRQDNLK